MQRLATTCTKGEHLSLISQPNTVTFGVTAFMLDPMHFIGQRLESTPPSSYKVKASEMPEENK